jgi:2-haloacid dehalogenase
MKNRILLKLTISLLLLVTTPLISAKKDIIFDLGNVLINWRPSIFYKEYFHDDANLNKTQEFYKETGIFDVDEMDKGVPLAEVQRKLAQKFPQYAEAISYWETMAMYYGSIKGSVAILESLHKQGYRLYAITNWTADIFLPYIREDQQYKPFLDLFIDIVISGVEKVCKPDPKIYQILLDRNGLDPKNCIFIDDTLKNVIAARKLGITAIYFESPEQLRRELHNLDIIIDVK